MSGVRPARVTTDVRLIAPAAALERLAHSQSAPAASVARARALLAVAEGSSYTEPVHLVGGRWVTRLHDGWRVFAVRLRERAEAPSAERDAPTRTITPRWPHSSNSRQAPPQDHGPQYRGGGRSAPNPHTSADFT
jgi:hypothetical protein